MASSRSLSRGVRAARPPAPKRGSEPQRPKVYLECVIGPSAPLHTAPPPPPRPAPRGSIFSSLASFRRRCLAQHDVMSTAPRFPRERGTLRRSRLGNRDPTPDPNGSRRRGRPPANYGRPFAGPSVTPLFKLGRPTVATLSTPSPPPPAPGPGPETGGPYIGLILLGALLGAGGARCCFLLAAHNARASRRSACAQQ